MLEALEPLVVTVAFQIAEERQADPLSKIGYQETESKLDEKSALFSIAISLRRIADHMDRNKQATCWLSTLRPAE